MSTLPTKKGQLSLEFLIMLSLTLVVFAGFYAGISHKHTLAMQYNTYLEMQAVTNRLVYACDLALTQGENFTKKIDLPNTIEGMKYNISYTNYEKGARIHFNSKNKHAIAYTSANITGNFTKGTNTLKNKGGVIYVN